VLAILVSFIWLASFPAWATATKVVASLFRLQTACAFGLALLSGAFLTADSLSEERRDGTLSLLFLTDLQARGIVLGKFIGMSVTALYGLLALLPLIGIPIMLGGVGLLEFGRMALALINTLFFSLTIGLAVSAYVISYSRGVFCTLALLALMGGVLPAAAESGSKLGWPAAWFCLACSSPFYPFWYARDATYALAPHLFWATLVASHVTAWIALGLASGKVGRSWQRVEMGPDLPDSRIQPWQRRRRSPRALASGDEAFDPVVRLIGDERLVRWAVWLMVIICAALLCANRSWHHQAGADVIAVGACTFLLKALVAFQACRFFMEARRSGAFELLLCTPLRNPDLIRAQWRAMLRVFLWPLIVFLLLCWFAACFPLGRTVTRFAGPVTEGLPSLRIGALGAAMTTLRWAADVLALGWFGMWVALTVRKPGLAPALTILAVLILPSVLVHFDLVADMLFISWGTTRLQEDFRRLADTTLVQPELVG
jgi:hypothetical protein